MRVFNSSSNPPPACVADCLHALVEQQVAVMRIVLPAAGIQPMRNATDPTTGRNDGVTIRVRVSGSQFTSTCTALAGIYDRAQARRWTKKSAWFRIGAVGPSGPTRTGPVQTPYTLNPIRSAWSVYAQQSGGNRASGRTFSASVVRSVVQPPAASAWRLLVAGGVFAVMVAVMFAVAWTRCSSFLRSLVLSFDF